MTPEIDGAFADSVYFRSSGNVFVMSDVRAMAMGKNPLANAPAESLSVSNAGVVTGDLYGYGDDNLFPNRLKKIINKNSKLKVGLGITAAQLLAGGIETGILDESGRFSPKLFEEWELWADRALFARQFSTLASRSLKTYYLAVVSLVLSRDGKKIVVAKTQPTPNARFSKPKNGQIEFCYLSADWDNVTGIDDRERVQKFRVVPNWYAPAEALRELVATTNEREFIYILRVPTDEAVYPIPDYYAVIEQGWVDVSNDVPQFKRWLLKNLSQAGYIFYFADWYWKKKFPDWERLLKSAKAGNTADLEILRDRKADEARKINDLLTGTDAAGRNIVSDLLVIDQELDQVTDSKLRKAITVEPIEPLNIEGKFLEDSQEADTQILFAERLDSSINGAAPGSQRQGGSDKREAFNVAQALVHEFELLLLELCYVIRDFNGLNPKMRFAIRRSTMQTLDKVPPGERETKNPKADD